MKLIWDFDEFGEVCQIRGKFYAVANNEFAALQKLWICHDKKYKVRKNIIYIETFQGIPRSGSLGRLLWPEHPPERSRTEDRARLHGRGEEIQSQHDAAGEGEVIDQRDF